MPKMLTKDELVRKQGDLDKLVKEAKSIQDEHTGKAMPEDVAAQFDTKCSEAETIQAELKEHNEAIAMEQKSRGRMDALHSFANDPNRVIPFNVADVNLDVDGKSRDLNLQGPAVALSMGKAFVASDCYKAGLLNSFQGASNAPAQLKMTPDGRHVIFEGEDYKRLIQLIETKAITSATSGDLIAPYRLSETLKDGDRPLRIRGLLTTGTSGSPTLEYVEEAFVSGAVEVAEGGTKPEASHSATKRTETARMIAHWVRVSNQMLKDAGQLSTYLDSQLIYGLDLREDDQLIWGDGTGDNLTGILNKAGIQDYAAAIHAIRGSASDTLLDKIRRARTNVALQYFPADGCVLHPIDWEEIELLKGSDEHYIWVVVSGENKERVWRLPVVETVAMQNPADADERHCIVGSFKMGAALFDVDAAAIEIGYANDDFITNYKRIRAEKRVIFPIWRPNVFVDIETAAASS